MAVGRRKTTPLMGFGFADTAVVFGLWPLMEPNLSLRVSREGFCLANGEPVVGRKCGNDRGQLDVDGSIRRHNAKSKSNTTASKVKGHCYRRLSAACALPSLIPSLSAGHGRQWKQRSGSKLEEAFHVN
ncbi:hypothetical protein L1049_002630 [Liquidambar formosana]|uniref:Uncharacterized protein n=1 Tax=Liquidambar formosana TaxID=63359 RepID=A0AAP0NKA3_LIQFO